MFIHRAVFNWGGIIHFIKKNEKLMDFWICFDFCEIIVMRKIELENYWDFSTKKIMIESKKSEIKVGNFT